MPTLETLDADALVRVVTGFRDLVVDHATLINRLNVYPVPDGDTGTNMGRTLDAVVAAVDDAGAGDLTTVCGAIAHGSLMGARGNSGVILSQILRGATTSWRDHGPIDAAGIADALRAAAEGAYGAVAEPVEGTILTVVRLAAEAAATAVAAGASLLQVVDAAETAAREALAATPTLLPVLAEAGVVDAGGAGFVLLFDAMLREIDGRALPEVPVPPPVGVDPTAIVEVPDAAMASTVPSATAGPRYEVMYFCDLVDARIDELKDAWGRIGDSIVVVGGDGLWNCHVHTDDIGAAIEAALDLDGRPHGIRVSDLFEEVVEEHARREAAMSDELVGAEHPPSLAVRAGAGLPPVTCAVVAVSSGEGLAELFGELGVQGVVRGGQTMNPSTAELLDTVEAVNARQVVILPNNKNIIAVAEQVDVLTSKSVAVVPTRSMVAALGALVVYDPEDDLAANVDEMRAAIGTIRTGEITTAVRDTSAGEVGDIAEGDWLGIIDGTGIVAAGRDLVPVITHVLDRLVADDGEILTVVTGADADPATTEAIGAWIADERADVDVEIHEGGQPLYPYLFGVE